MLLLCNCLNIQLDVKHEGVELQLQHCNHLPEPPAHQYFTQDVYVVELGERGVMYEITELMRITNLSQTWRLYTCLCCNTHTHCVHLPTHMYTANKDLLVESKLEELQQHPCYSAAFRVVLPTSTFLATPSKRLNTDQMPYAIQKLFNSYLQQEQDASEDRMKQFEKRQHHHISTVTSRAMSDGYVMLDLLARIDQINLNLKSVEMSADACPPCPPLISASLHQLQSGAGDIDATDVFGSASDLAQQHNDEHSRRTYNTSNEMFHFDDLEQDQHYPPGHISSSEEESDVEDDYFDPAGDTSTENAAATGGLYAIPSSDGDRDGPMVAQSVPISIPNFGVRPNRRTKPKSKVSRTPADIAASILAISRSLHSDSLVGGLPKHKKQRDVEENYQV